MTREPGGPPGILHPQAKLDDDKVRAMRRKYAEGGYSYHTLAVRYGVTYTTARQAIRGVTWAHVTDEPIEECTRCKGTGVEPA